MVYEYFESSVETLQVGRMEGISEQTFYKLQAAEGASG